MAYALKCNKNVIPIKVRIDDFPRNLPGDIASICHKSGPKYDDYYFDAFIDKLQKYFLKSQPKPNIEQYVKVRKEINLAEDKEAISSHPFTSMQLLRMFIKSIYK